MFTPKKTVATWVCVLTAFAVTACGDDESVEATDATDTFPYLTEEYEPNCAGYTAKLRQCDILSEGEFACTDPATPTAECRYRCVTVASCAILSELVCGNRAAPPLQECLVECDEFKCASGGAIVPSWVCDGQADCGDGSDEADCFSCGTGEVFPPSYVCDFYGDCADGSDEVACGGFSCDSGETIRESSRCDLFADCPDGSDETGCDVFVCEISAESIRPDWKCDGQEDCLDGSDEAGCAVTSCP